MNKIEQKPKHLKLWQPKAATNNHAEWRNQTFVAQECRTRVKSRGHVCKVYKPRGSRFQESWSGDPSTERWRQATTCCSTEALRAETGSPRCYNMHAIRYN